MQWQCQCRNQKAQNAQYQNAPADFRHISLISWPVDHSLKNWLRKLITIFLLMYLEVLDFDYSI